MKRVVSVVLTGMLILGTASAAYADTSNEKISTAETSNVENSTSDISNVETAGNAIYKDLKNTNWAYEAVNTMSQKGIVKGYNDGSFKPGNVVTYGEFIKMALVSATKEDVGNAPYVNPITGAKQNWAKNYYDKALGIKYFGSTDIKENQLSYPIPRSDMALIISNILGEIKIDNYDELESDLKDVNSETKYDYDIIKTYATGIITGYEDSTFKPEKTLTRAESATVIYRFVDESKRVLPKLEEKQLIEKEKDTPTTGTDIASVIENYKTFDWDETYGSVLTDAKSYEYITDMSGYKIEEVVNRGTKGLRINGEHPLDLGWGKLYLMRDKKIVEITQNGIHDANITTIEYFVFARSMGKEDVLGIMPNPLYVK